MTAAPPHANETLDLVVPECIACGVDFKIIGDPFLHDRLNSKRQSRGHSGKFMTIYPPDDDAFAELIEQLYRTTRDTEVAGPRILSDRQYKDSSVLYYRYGGFNPPRRVRSDGTYETLLISPRDRPLVDERLPYFQLPEWVDDPFRAQPRQSESGGVLLAERYLVEAALGFSNSGGVYQATDTRTNEAVFIKEARPLTNCWSRQDRLVDAVSLLRREFVTLRRLHDLTFVPDPLELVEESSHLFLVEQHIPAVTLRQYWAFADVILAPYIRIPGRIESWTEKFMQVAAKLIRMVSTIHGRGVLLGDLSPDNILINTATLRMWLVDFESAVDSTDDAELVRHAAMWGTPGFVSPRRAERRVLLPDDDLHAVGLILYSGLASVTSLFDLEPAGLDRFLDEFTALGLPEVVGEIIRSLLQGDGDKALSLLDTGT
ncbi:hypothetical protein ACIOK4_45045 [Streptomyces bottropensis]|uniref:class III lanthionine synthetase LanKC N-terminal domain-containing protein n=1 Tax=Streptomyces bottropensis TaxID=42235 RepID=UPI0037950F59